MADAEPVVREEQEETQQNGISEETGGGDVAVERLEDGSQKEEKTPVSEDKADAEKTPTLTTLEDDYEAISSPEQVSSDGTILEDEEPEEKEPEVIVSKDEGKDPEKTVSEEREPVEKTILVEKEENKRMEKEEEYEAVSSPEQETQKVEEQEKEVPPEETVKSSKPDENDAPSDSELTPISDAVTEPFTPVKDIASPSKAVPSVPPEEVQVPSPPAVPVEVETHSTSSSEATTEPATPLDMDTTRSTTSSDVTIEMTSPVPMEVDQPPPSTPVPAEEEETQLVPSVPPAAQEGIFPPEETPDDDLEPEDYQEYRCDLCDKKMVSQQHLAAHQRFHKRVDKQKKYECPLCFQSMRNHFQLNSHMRVHKERRPPSTPENPPPETKDATSLSPRHQNRKDYHSLHHGPAIRVSKRKLSTDSRLSSTDSDTPKSAVVIKEEPLEPPPKLEGQGPTPNFVKRPSGAVQIKPFRCDHCPAVAYHDDNALALHVRLFHEGVTPEQCQFCWKSFPTRAKLEGHTRQVHNQFGGSEAVCKVNNNNGSGQS